MGIRLHVGANQFLKQLQHFPRLGMTAKLFFREEHLIVHPELKGTLTAHNKRKGVDDVLIVAQNIFRHTDGAFAVVSGHAVFKRDRVFVLHIVTSKG
mgnify:CR=1 FL=1